MIFLLIFAILTIFIILFLSINIKIEVENLKILLSTKNRQIINKESKICMKIYLLKKMKVKEINLKKFKTNYMKNKVDKLKRRIKQNSNLKFNIDTIKALRKNNYKIEKFMLKICVGVEDAAVTAIGVGTVSGIIGFLLKDKVANMEKQKFEVIPIYENKNILKIDFDGIFSLNITNIINIIKFFRKGRVKNNGRTFYRRSYSYSNE